ncbi:SRP1/TIP1 family protein NDAI_0J01370 [Naumovozyma dairenensis CBS 421]|uniref:Temperature shock-inducible protein 1 n=1 Tax=Naumovozyma dairenensis (strain ATCC 10597 / BCRC 20456 / CBS 421 / NBRC 0211 / NRRL Y-12639) TaxID=1071378 RepID=G0WGV1_NAUDC|nr:hypothetical protein NDAI_0J01370 [Naumovozyma dairenensis CBS 421]CCD27029.1 hypothetical protein NDAI_0J01370 [Naumovozyma dairenensis CBS 421]
MNTKFTVLLAAIASASVASAAVANTTTEIAELKVLLDDVKSNLNDYVALAFTPDSGVSLDTLPAGVLDVGKALFTASDDSYTTLYANVDFDGVSSLMTKLPWYQSRLEAPLQSIANSN